MGDTEERLSGLLQGPGFHIPQKLPCQETFRMQSSLNPQHAHKLVRERGRDRERERLRERGRDREREGEEERERKEKATHVGQF